jgi:hypothetical protein
VAAGQLREPFGLANPARDFLALASKMRPLDVGKPAGVATTASARQTNSNSVT